MQVNKRELLKQLGIGGTALGGFATVTTASDNTAEPIRKLAASVAENEQEQYLAFTASDQDTLCLYLAKGTASTDEAADEIIQVTNPDGGSVLNIRWDGAQKLKFWQNGSVYELKIGNKTTNTKISKVKTQVVPGDITRTSSTEDGLNAGQDDYIAPGGGSGDDPDWMDDPEYSQDGFERCQDAELGEVCIDTTSVKPKYYTNCYGTEVPLVGLSFNAASITTGSGGLSIALDLWVGVNPTSRCLYWGSSMFNVCHTNCGIEADITQAELEEQVKADARRAFSNLEDDISTGLGLAAEAVDLAIKILALIAVIIFFLLIQIVTGGSAWA